MNHGVYKLSTKINRFLLNTDQFEHYTAMWLKLNQSYMALQIYIRQNRATAVPSKHTFVQQGALTYKLTCARGHSYHIKQVLSQSSQDDQVASMTTKNADRRRDRQKAFQLYHQVR